MMHTRQARASRGRRAVRGSLRGKTPSIAVLGLAVLWGCQREPVEVKGPIDPTKYAVYFARYPFGGHTTDVWRDRLEELRPGGPHADAAVYALTVERAQKNGLVVEPGVPGTGAHIVVKPGAQLTASLMQRLDVK